MYYIFQSQQIEMTDKKEFLSTELIFRSIGYKCSKAEPEIPFNFFNCIGNARVMPGNFDFKHMPVECIWFYVYFFMNI